MTGGMTAFNTTGGIHEVPVDAAPGRLWLCGKHVIAPAPDSLLAMLGASTVVCLTRRHELDHRYPGYVRWLEAAPASRAVWFPVHDLSAPEVDRALPVLDDLVARLRAGDGLIVHCAAGIGRAGTTAVALLVLLGMPLDDALAHVRAHRPMAGPEAGSQLEFVRTVAAMRAG